MNGAGPGAQLNPERGRASPPERPCSPWKCVLFQTFQLLKVGGCRMMSRMESRQCQGGLRVGRIELICGCMFSGKSLHLVERVRQARQAGLKVVAFKHSCDDRYGQTHIVTHDGQRAEAMPVASAGQIPSLAGDAQVIVIDEAQFFDDSLVAVCKELAMAGKTVVVAGLDRDSWGLPFEPIPSLGALADRVTRTLAVCARCGEPADYTQRLVPVADRTMIGGAESYEPRCERCFQAPPIEQRR